MAGKLSSDGTLLFLAGRFRPAQRSEKKEKARQTGSDLVTLVAVAGDGQGDPLLGKPKHLVVLWLEAERISDLLLSLSSFAPDRSSVTVISRSKPEVRPPWLLRLCHHPERDEPRDCHIPTACLGYSWLPSHTCDSVTWNGDASGH